MSKNWVQGGFPGKVIFPSIGVGLFPISLPYLLVLLSITESL